MAAVRIIILALLLQGCLSIPDTFFTGYVSGEYDCEWYGVRQLYQPMGHVVVAQGVDWELIDELCAVVPVDEPLSGCAIARDDGMVELYWRLGDEYAERHEWCHAIHGVEHT